MVDDTYFDNSLLHDVASVFLLILSSFHIQSTEYDMCPYAIYCLPFVFALLVCLFPVVINMRWQGWHMFDLDEPAGWFCQTSHLTISCNHKHDNCLPSILYDTHHGRKRHCTYIYYPFFSPSSNHHCYWIYHVCHCIIDVSNSYHEKLSFPEKMSMIIVVVISGPSLPPRALIVSLHQLPWQLVSSGNICNRYHYCDIVSCSNQSSQ